MSQTGRSRARRQSGSSSPPTPRELSPDQLRWHCDPALFEFETTESIATLTRLVGQDRGTHAISMGLSFTAPGYNVYVAGPVGTGRSTEVRTQLDEFARHQKAPSDWCYVHNFVDPYRPVAVELPSGRGPDLRRDMERFVTACRREIPRALESDQYQERRSGILQRIEGQRDGLLSTLRAAADRLGFVTQVTPMGIVNAPLLAPGKPMSPEAFELLPPQRQAEIRAAGQELQRLADETLLDIHRLERDAREQFRALERDAALFAIGHLLDELKATYNSSAKLGSYLDAVRVDILDHLDDFHASEQAESQGREMGRAAFSERYGVNVLVSQAADHGTPVVNEPNPTYYNLLGRIDYRASMGAMSTDFSLIKPGALHRANGGFLSVQARDLLINPYAWEALKRSLRDAEVRIENLGEQYSAFPTTALKPEPIPLHVKVVLIGDLMTYLMLLNLDEDFGKLFKVKAQFAGEMTRSPETIRAYAEFVALQAAEEHLLPFHRSAIVEIIEHSARLAEHQERLLAQFNTIANLIVECDHWARDAGATLVQREHVIHALDDQDWRANLIESEVQRAIDENAIAIDVTSELAGQVNGLSVLSVGDHTFGRPSRITARIGMGSDGVVNIEREVKLSGRTHDKGVLILGGYLLGTYAQNAPLALSARITFEQVYDEVDGDSASGAELCALISGLAEVPIRQGIAMTGSVNQFGQIQAVGGVTRKIEGFFEVCRSRGLTGNQGVILPAPNVRHLMLRPEVIEAVAQGAFHIWAVETIDDAIELLTGRPGGVIREDGTYPPESIHGRAQARLAHFAKSLQQHGFARDSLHQVADRVDGHA
ncbi:MAG: Lon protease family protein [Chloroflexota bacterium]